MYAGYISSTGLPNADNNTLKQRDDISNKKVDIICEIFHDIPTHLYCSVWYMLLINKISEIYVQQKHRFSWPNPLKSHEIPWNPVKSHRNPIEIPWNPKKCPCFCWFKIVHVLGSPGATVGSRAGLGEHLAQDLLGDPGLAGLARAPEPRPDDMGNPNKKCD